MSHARRTLRQVASLAGKEWRLLARNPQGLVALFLMPALFVLVMSFVLKNSLVAPAELPATGWVVEAPEAAAEHWVASWIATHGGQRLADRAAAVTALRERRVDAVVVLRGPFPGAGGEPYALWLGNLVHPAAAARLRAELGRAVIQARLQVAAAQAGPFASLALSDVAGPGTPGEAPPELRYLYEIESGRTLTAVQQSVPAWLVFGMFFVVVPIAGVLIQERDQGTLARLASFGVSPGAVLLGKLLAFLALNAVQLMLMLGVGVWLVPLLGGDRLVLDIAPGWFLLAAVSTSIAAVALGLLVAARSRRFDQAAALGSGLNVLLGAIAGVMVPRPLMPPALQTLAEWTPMGWSLDAMMALFLGRPEPARILTLCAALLAFAALCLVLAWGPIRRAGVAQ